MEGEGSLAKSEGISVKPGSASLLYNVLLGSRSWGYLKAGAGGTRYGGSKEEGNSATIGIENAAGDDALQYSFNQAAVSNGTAFLFSLPPSGFVEGTVTDANDGLPVVGATRAM